MKNSERRRQVFTVYHCLYMLKGKGSAQPIDQAEIRFVAIDMVGH
jgi:hypothetical protein